MKMVIYKADKESGFSRCIKVGLLGCNRIESIHEGETNGIDIYRYVAHFDDKDSIEIKTPLLALS